MNFVTVDEVGEVEEEEEEEEEKEVVTTRTRSQAKKRTRQTPGNTQNYINHSNVIPKSYR